MARKRRSQRSKERLKKELPETSTPLTRAASESEKKWRTGEETMSAAEAALFQETPEKPFRLAFASPGLSQDLSQIRLVSLIRLRQRYIDLFSHFLRARLIATECFVSSGRDLSLAIAERVR